MGNKSKSKSSNITMENEYVRLMIDGKGRFASLLDKASGKDYCEKPSPLWELMVDRERYFPSDASLEGKELTVRFGNTAVAKFLVENKKHYFTLTLDSISPAKSIEEITLANLAIKKLKNIATTVNASYDDNFASCVMALNVAVNCFPLGSSLIARCYSKYGMKNNSIAIICCPFNVFKKVIEEVEINEGLPHIKLSGVWAKDSPDVKRTYLFIQDMSEENCDRVIDCAKRMNAGMIMILESWCDAISGHFPISKKLFPGGSKGLKGVVEKIHSAGMKAGLHFLAAGITPNDAYITPVPDRRFFKDAEAMLASNIDAKIRDIFFKGRFGNFPTELDPRGVYWANGLDIQIDNEIITYGARTEREPFLFAGCIRGTFGTKPEAHKKGTKIYHLFRQYGLFIRDLDSSLADEVADNLVNILTKCSFDMMYFDGSERLQGAHWYYNAKLHMSFYNKIPAAIRNNIFYQGSSHSHFSWHMISRAACADGFRNIRDNVNNAMTKYPNWFVNFMPLDIGWYELGGPYVSYSDIEYIMCHSIGWNSSCGFETCLKNLEDNPKTLEMIATYEKLRLSNYFSEDTKIKLRQPGAYHLIQGPGNKWKLVKKEESIRG